MDHTKYEPVVKTAKENGLKSTDSSIIRYRTVRTVSVLVCFGALGMGSNVTGPTLVHMRHILNADISSISVVFALGRIGFLIGSVTCGLLYDRLNAELQLFFSTFLVGLLTTTLPWSDTLYGYFALNALQGLTRGYLDTAAQPYVISLWAGERLKDPMMQGLHAMWSVGSCLGPFIIAPFLVDLPDNTSPVIATNQTTELIATDSTATASIHIESLYYVRYSFAIIGLIHVLTSSLFVVSYFLAGPTCLKSKTQTAHAKGKEIKILSTPATAVLIMLQSLIVFCYLWYSGIPGELMASFVVEGLGWQAHKGAWITGLFFGATSLGRIISTPLALIVSPTKMIVTSLTFTTASFIIMALFANVKDLLLWVSVAMAGFAMSGMFASTLSWNSNVMTLTGAVSGVYLAGGAVGGMTGSVLAGYLFDYRSYMWVVYLSLIASVGHVILFIVSTCLVKCCRNDTSQHRVEMNDAISEL